MSEVHKNKAGRAVQFIATVDGCIAYNLMSCHSERIIEFAPIFQCLHVNASPLSSFCRSPCVQSVVALCFQGERLFISRFTEKKSKQEEDAANRYEKQTAVISCRGLLSCYRTLMDHRCFLSALGEVPPCMKTAIISMISYANDVVTHADWFHTK